MARAVLGPDDADDAWSETFLAAMTAYPDLPADVGDLVGDSTSSSGSSA
jgi:hypothetical protein